MLLEDVKKGERIIEFNIIDDGNLCFQSRLCAPDNVKLNSHHEAHRSPYTIDPRSTRMCQRY